MFLCFKVLVSSYTYPNTPLYVSHVFIILSSHEDVYPHRVTCATFSTQWCDCSWGANVPCDSNRLIMSFSHHRNNPGQSIISPIARSVRFTPQFWRSLVTRSIPRSIDDCPASQSFTLVHHGHGYSMLTHRLCSSTL